MRPASLSLALSLSFVALAPQAGAADKGFFSTVTKPIQKAIDKAQARWQRFQEQQVIKRDINKLRQADPALDQTYRRAARENSRAGTGFFASGLLVSSAVWANWGLHAYANGNTPSAIAFLAGAVGGAGVGASDVKTAITAPRNAGREAVLTHLAESLQGEDRTHARRLVSQLDPLTRQALRHQTMSRRDQAKKQLEEEKREVKERKLAAEKAAQQLRALDRIP